MRTLEALAPIAGLSNRPLAAVMPWQHQPARRNVSLDFSSMRYGRTTKVLAKRLQMYYRESYSVLALQQHAVAALHNNKDAYQVLAARVTDCPH